MAFTQRARQAWQRFRHSLKSRLIALFLGLTVAAALLLFGTLQRALQGGWEGYARPLTADYVDRLAAEIGTPPDVERARALTARLPIALRIEGPSVQFDSHPKAVRFRFDQDEERHRAGQWGLKRTLADGHVLSVRLAAPPEGQRPRWLGWLALGLLMVITLLAYLAVRRLLKPLDAIGAGVSAYTAGDFGRPIAAFAPRGRLRDDELGQLATRIDGMASSLADMLQAKRTLLLAISHELRSPLTRARLHAELLDESPERQALLRELAEMRDLIGALLEGERLQQGHAALQTAAVDLSAVLQTMAEQGGVRLDLRVASAVVWVDEPRLRLMLRNLLSNAQRHAAGAQALPELFLRVQADGDWAVGVRDYGAGVADDHLPRLGEAFYRPDSARTRSAGGVGLGLHLCRQVAQAHGGTLQIRNASPGLEVAMVWKPQTGADVLQSTDPLKT